MPRKKKEQVPPPTVAPPPPTRAAAVNQVLKWVVAGQTESDIAEAAARLLPGQPVAEMLAEVMDDLEKSARFNRDIVIGWCFEAYRDLYRRMVEVGDFPSALRAVKQILEMAVNVPEPEEPEEAEEAAQPGSIREDQAGIVGPPAGTD